MKALVTGSAGHLGEGLVRTLQSLGHEVTGMDIKASTHTRVQGSITDANLVRDCMAGVDTVFHAATLHKPHVATHSMQDFVGTNVSGALVLLEAATSAGVRAFVFTSTTSAFGHALRPPHGEPAAWITEDVSPIPKNIYGVTKLAAESLCQLIHQKCGLSCVVLRTSRFFPEEDDDAERRAACSGDNTKVNELLFRRADLADMVSAHLAAAEKAPDIGFGRYIVSATTPFEPSDLAELRSQAPAVLKRRIPAYEAVYKSLGWHMFPSIDRVYNNSAARRDLGWAPAHGFEHALGRLAAGEDFRSDLARIVGAKPYHEASFDHLDGPYPVD